MKLKERIRPFVIAAMLLCMLSAAGTESRAAELSTPVQEYRNQVLVVCGIADTTDLQGPATRAEFAKMLVLSSSQRELIGTSAVAAAPDVPGTHAYAKYIRTALRNGWMRNRLNGNFEPDGTLTLTEAAKAVMTALGYTDSDFTGNVNETRLTKFAVMGLGDGVSASAAGDQLTKQQAMNVIYNLLKTSPKNGGNSIYGSAISLSLNSDGSLNATEALDDTMQGPLLIKTYDQLKTALPFDINAANCYYNGQKTSYYTNLQLLSYTSQLQTCGWLIVYYNEASKTVWGYGQDTGSMAYHCIRGTVNAVYYDADNIVSPSSVVINGDQYTLGSTEAKFMFSLNGTISVGDEVVVICKASSQNDDESVSGWYITGVVIYSKKGDK